jgi:predicted nucleic acid-binding protein
MLAEAMMLGQLAGGNPAKQLSAKPEVVKRLTIYRDKVTALITLGLGFEACTKTDLFDKALFLQERYGLLTNDSVIAAMALRLDADALVSTDTRFKVVKDLTIYTPSDLDMA